MDLKESGSFEMNHEIIECLFLHVFVLIVPMKANYVVTALFVLLFLLSE